MVTGRCVVIYFYKGLDDYVAIGEVSVNSWLMISEYLQMAELLFCSH